MPSRENERYLNEHDDNLRWDPINKHYYKRCDKGHWFIYELGHCPECAIGKGSNKNKPTTSSDRELQDLKQSINPDEKLSQPEKPESRSIPEIKPEIKQPEPAKATPGDQIIDKSAKEPERPVNTPPTRPMNNSSPHKSHTGLIVTVFSVVITVMLIFFLFHSNAPPVPNQIQITPTPTTPGEYTNFRDTVSGYSLEYPSSWQADAMQDGEALFTYNRDNTVIDVKYLSVDYQTEFDTISSQDLLESKIARQGSITYSTFWTKASPVERVYVCDMATGTLILKCTNANSLNTMSCIGHMLTSFHLLNPNNAGIAPMSSTQVGIITPTTIQNPTPITITTTVPATQTLPAEQSIDPQTGVYENYYLGLVDNGGVLGGDGCYDDTGKFIVLINNKNAVNPTYAQLVNFLQQDKTDQFPYTYTGLTGGSYYGTAESHVDLKRIQSIIDGTAQPNPPDICSDFAERLHNDAEMAGIRCAFVSLGMSGYTDPYHLGIPSDSGHACDAFQTTDRGLIYIDDTNSPGPARCVKTVNIQQGQQYIPQSLFPDPGWNSTWDSMGTVTSICVTWDGNWNN